MFFLKQVEFVSMMALFQFCAKFTFSGGDTVKFVSILVSAFQLLMIV